MNKVKQLNLTAVITDKKVFPAKLANFN